MELVLLLSSLSFLDCGGGGGGGDDDVDDLELEALGLLILLARA